MLLSLSSLSTSLLGAIKKERYSYTSSIKPLLSGLHEQQEHRGLKSFLKFWRQEETQLSHYPPADKYLKATIKKTQPCIPCYLPGSHVSTMGATLRQTATQGGLLYQAHKHPSPSVSTPHHFRDVSVYFKPIRGCIFTTSVSGGLFAERRDEGTAVPPHPLQGEPQGYSSRKHNWWQKTCRSGCRLELFIGVFLPFREGEDSVTASHRHSLNQARQILSHEGNLRAKASP